MSTADHTASGSVPIGIEFSSTGVRVCAFRDNALEHVCFVKGCDIPPLFDGKEHFDSTIEQWTSVLRHVHQLCAERLQTGGQLRHVVIAVPGYCGVHDRIALQQASAKAGITVARIGMSPEMACVAHWHEHIALPPFGFRATPSSGSTGSDDGNMNADEEEVNSLYIVDDERSLSASVITQAEGVSEVRATISRVVDANDACNVHDIVTQVLCDAKLMSRGSDEERKVRIVLVGSTGRLEELRSLFPNREISLLPREFVAHGAAYLAAMLVGAEGVREVLVIASFPFSLGVRTCDGSVCEVCHRDMSYPQSRSEIFTTCSDNQRTASFHMYEGESGVVQGNKYIGTLVLDGLPPRPAGAVELELAINVSVNGEVSVSVTDRANPSLSAQLTIADFIPTPEHVDDTTFVRARGRSVASSQLHTGARL